MDLQTAIDLIAKAVHKTIEPQQWTDLGAGEGLFTHALGTLLPKGSSILAIDKSGAALKSIRIKTPGISLNTRTGDFTKFPVEIKFDGILMANSLHYVQDQVGFVSKLKSQLKSNGKIVIVEYDRTQPNPWVPYPVPLPALKEIATQTGFISVEQLEAVPSVYENLKIYSAILRLR